MFVTFRVPVEKEAVLPVNEPEKGEAACQAGTPETTVKTWPFVPCGRPVRTELEFEVTRQEFRVSTLTELLLFITIAGDPPV